MMMGLQVFLQKLNAAHPDPSALLAAWVNSFLNLSKLPNSPFITSARVPEGAFFGLSGGGHVVPEESVEDKSADVEGYVFQEGLYVQLRITLAGSFQLL